MEKPSLLALLGNRSVVLLAGLLAVVQAAVAAVEAVGAVALVAIVVVEGVAAGGW